LGAQGTSLTMIITPMGGTTEGDVAALKDACGRIKDGDSLGMLTTAQ
jgi:hypothetical protein